MDVRVGLWRRLSAEELMLLNCGVGEDTWESLGLQGDPTSQSILMMLKLKLQYFGHLMRRVDLLEKTLMLGGLEAGGEGDDRGWDVWMASLTRWTWVWVKSGSWWWTGRPGVLRFMGSQSRTRLSDWTELRCNIHWKWKWKSFSHGFFVTPWTSPDQNTGVGSLSLLQGIFTTHGSNPAPLHCRQILYQLSHKGSHELVYQDSLWISVIQWVSLAISMEINMKKNCP